MKSASPLQILCGAVLAALTATSVAAQESPYFYAGGGVGRARANFDENLITAKLLGGGVTTTSISQHERDTAYKFFGGYQFNRHFALEAGYFNLGKFGFTSTTSPAGTLNGNIKLRGGFLDVVGTLPITENLAANARVGAQYARTYDAFSSTGAVNNINYTPNVSTRKTNYKAGVGLQYAFSPSFLLRGEAERYRIDGVIANHTNVNVYSISVVLPFGTTPKALPAATHAAAPTYVPPTPPAPLPPPLPPPVATPPPPPQIPQRVVVSRATFSAESLFGFDQSSLKPEGRSSLDRFVQDIQGTQYEMITVEGHADRLGSVPYNQRLSLRRAEAVKSYLVMSGKIAQAKITAIGKGESSPVTQAGACKGTKRTPALIACLQPDRRVDVMVTAMR